MSLMTCKGLRRWCASISLLLLLGMQNAWATDYVYPGATAPLLLSNGDTLTVSTATTPFETPSTGTSASTVYTVDFSGATTGGVTITVNQGGIISYNGTNGGAASINSARSDLNSNTSIININGEVSAGTGLYAIAVKNTNATPADIYNINIGTTGSVVGTILANSVYSVGLNLTGNASVTGVINLGVSSTGLSTLLVGASGQAIFTPTESISNIGLLHIANTSTMTLGVPTAGITAITIDPSSTLNVNYTLVGAAASDGNIINNGTMVIAAGISKTGTFAGSGTNVVTEGGSSGLSVTTSNYKITTHNSVMIDVNNYGNMTLSSANFLYSGNTSTFELTYGSDGYTPGYLPGGTYTLVTTTNGIVYAPLGSPATSLPTATLFLAFSNLAFNSNNVTVYLTRTPFNTYAQSPLTQSVGATLESIGMNSPPQSFVDLLDAVEQSTTANAVELSLRQLTPLSNAPFYGYQIQNDCMYQVQLRLASLRDGSANYFAGDTVVFNHPWIRGFGSYANQRPKDESYGYYGTSGGVALGFDRDLDVRYTIGAAFAYALSHVTDKVNTSSVTALKSYIAMVYGTYNYTATSHLDWILSVTANQYSANRYVNINTFSQIATSSYGSQQVSAMAIAGQDYEAFGFMQLTPQASAQYTFTKQYAYAESGGGAANLNISRKNSDIVTLGLGGIASIPIWVDPSIIIPDIHGWFYYDPVAGKQDTIFSFVQGGSPMSSYMNLSRTGISIGTSLTIAVVDTLEVKLNFDYQVQDRYNAWITYLNLRYSL